MSLGVFTTKLKNGQNSYRASINFKGRHISLGSFISFDEANSSYEEARLLLSSADGINEHLKYPNIKFDKFVSLINFRDNAYYIKNPIYLYKSFFNYYLSSDEVFTFDIDDLFYYSNHRIQKRGGRLFCADFGMQVSLNSRYGIKPFAVKNRDYIFINGDDKDYRYDNIRIINNYNGVLYDETAELYTVKIHLKGNYIVGRYSSEEYGAIAYNKAADYLKSIGITKDFKQNYIETITAKKYADIYSEIDISTFISHINKDKL